MRPTRPTLRTLTLALLVVLVMASGAAAQTSNQTHVEIFEDLQMFVSNNRWLYDDSNPVNNGGIRVDGLSEAGNNFLRVSQTLVPGRFGSQARLAHVEYHWQPNFDGPLSGLGFRLRAKVDVPDPMPGYTTVDVSASVNLLVRQGGLRFKSLRSAVWRSGFQAENTWIAYPEIVVSADDFRDLEGGALRPNFGANGAELRFGLEVSLQLPTATGATYVVDIDDVAVFGLRTQNLPPGLAFKPDDGFLDPNGELLQVAKLDPGQNLKMSLLRVGSLTQALTGRGQAVVKIDGAPDRHLSWSQGVSPGSSSAQVDLPVFPELCPFQVEATLDQVEGGRIYAPSKARMLVAVDDGTSCVWTLLGYLTRQVACPSAPPRVKAEPPSDLDTLRAFRDQIMAPSPAGRYYRKLYNTHSPTAIKAVFKRPKLVVDAGRAWAPWVAGAAAMVAGNGGSVTVTPEMHSDLREILDGLKLAGAPSLARAIEREEARLDFDSWAGKSFAFLWQRVLTSGMPSACVADAHGLCLNGGRYRVEANWTKPDGETGRAQAVRLTPDSGYFWFFNAANVEILTKVLNGCGVNGRTWSFSAGLTNLEVELFVFDAQTGIGKSYANPQRTAFAPVLDTGAISCSGASAPLNFEEPSSGFEPTEEQTFPPDLGAKAGSCVSGLETLCLRNRRFEVEVDWTRSDGSSGPAFARPLTDDTGTFWFFRADNLELVVKVLDACSVSGMPRFWVFAGGTTNVGVEMRVLDTQTGASKRYQRPVGQAFEPVLDTDAFATCGG